MFIQGITTARGKNFYSKLVNSDVYPLAKCTIRGNEYPCPRRSHNLTDWAFGADYMTPDKGKFHETKYKQKRGSQPIG